MPSRSPKLNLYRGEMLCLAELGRRTGISSHTLCGWQARFGRVSEQLIELHLHKRSEDKRIRELGGCEWTGDDDGEDADVPRD